MAELRHNLIHQSIWGHERQGRSVAALLDDAPADKVDTLKYDPFLSGTGWIKAKSCKNIARGEKFTASSHT